ncbi:MAG: 50S ribosomal protein L5 [Patescibacteria group bacterium]
MTNIMAEPKLVKVVVNSGIGDLVKSKDAQEKFKNDLAQITGQLPSVRKAKISVAGFNLRAGMPVGMAVTLRGKRAMNFFKKLTSIVLPRLRDFRGVSKNSFDKFGNYTLGVAEHTVFPEIDPTKIDKPRSLEITVVTTAKDKDQGFKLLEALGMPFEKESI